MIGINSSLYRERGTWKAASGGAAIVQCPDCGRCFGVGPGVSQHEIDHNGNVHPSVICPRCDFHEFMHLDGWVKQP